MEEADDAYFSFRAEHDSLSFIQVADGTIHFSPDIPLEVGELYRVEIQEESVSIWKLVVSKPIEEAIYQ